MYKELHQLDTEELEMIASLIETDMPRVCALLFTDQRHKKESIVKEIGQWAVNRKVVLDNQIRKNPHVALVFEKVCYRIWQKLPSSIKSLKIDTISLANMAMTIPVSQCGTHQYGPTP